MRDKLMHHSRARSLLKASIVGLIALMLSACSIFSSDESGPKPSPLPAFTPKVKVTEAWSQNIGNGQGGIWLDIHPAISGNTIYAASHSGDVSAFERDTGKQLWSKKLDVKITGGVSASEGLVVLGTSSGKIIALNARNGDQKWTANAAGEILSAPAIGSNTVVTQSINGKVIAFDAADGHKIWQQSSLLPVLLLRGSSSPVIARGLVFTGFSNGDMNAWNLRTGKEVWKNTIALPEGSSELSRMVDIDATPLLVGSHLYAISYQGNMKAINAPNGQTLWSRKASSYQSLTEGHGNLYTSSAKDRISAIDESTGGSLWSQNDLAYRQISAPASYDQYIVVGDYEGYIHVLSQKDGSIVGRYHVASSGIRVQPIVDKNMVYVYTNGGELAALTIKRTK